MIAGFGKYILVFSKELQKRAKKGDIFANFALGPSASLVIADVLRCSFPKLDVRERKGKVRVQCKIWSCEYRIADGRMCCGIAERHPAAGRDGQCDEHYRGARPTHRAGVRDCGKTFRLFCRRWW